jgi:hypothetical protein
MIVLIKTVSNTNSPLFCLSILNESISKLSMKYARIWGTVKIYALWRHIHSSAENVARAVWMNDASQTKIR